MSQTPITVTYTIEEVLTRIEGKIDRLENKLDSLQKEVTDLKVGQATLTEKVENIDKRLGKVETNQFYQIWALIVLIAGAVVTGIYRSLFMGNNP